MRSIFAISIFCNVLFFSCGEKKQVEASSFVYEVLNDCEKIDTLADFVVKHKGGNIGNVIMDKGILQFNLIDTDFSLKGTYEMYIYLDLFGKEYIELKSIASNKEILFTLICNSFHEIDGSEELFNKLIKGADTIKLDRDSFMIQWDKMSNDFDSVMTGVLAP